MARMRAAQRAGETPRMAESNLSRTLAEIRRRIEKNGRRGINEQNTKATLIEPVLGALGWDTEDVDEVVIRENKVSITPIRYDLTDLSMLEELAQWNIIP